ncbi:DNA polymerase iota [Neocloeon triangulifer]|uniref:DNA polymerase iota n=1 Tax=Neocloeon triangulifer TaxID=2078957 RepID=UPI00286F24AC|nr:DNA polymerase iota [Neocloeon triangulifer]
MIENPCLRDKPLGIQQKNIVVTCNYVAREHGVTKLMLLQDAQKACPNLVLVSGEDLSKYRAMSDKVTELLQSRFASLVERLGMDENFVDVSDLVKNHKAEGQVKGHVYSESNPAGECVCGCDQRVKIGSHIAEDMRAAIFDELGLTTCAGVSYNKVLAKLVGSTHKPNQQTTLFSGQVLTLINGLSGVRSIPGIGRQMSNLLKSQRILEIFDLQSASLNKLEKVFKNKERAKLVQKLAFGIDDSPVKPSGKPKSLGIEDAVQGIKTAEEAGTKIRILSGRLLDLLVSQEDNRQPGTVRLTLRKWNKLTKEAKRESRQAAMPNLLPVQTENFKSSSLDKMMPLLMNRFADIVKDTNFHLTLVGVAFTNFRDKKCGKGSISSFLQPAPKKIKTDAEASTSQEKALPPNVDKQVFEALPPEMKEEILSEWKSRPKASPDKTRKKSSIADYFNKK